MQPLHFFWHHEKLILGLSLENINSSTYKKFVTAKKAMTNRTKSEVNSHCWITAKTNFFLLLFPARFAHACYSSRMIERFLNWGDHRKPKSGKIKGHCHDCITLFKKLYIRQKGFPLNLHTNGRNLLFSYFKRPSTHMQDALENVFAQREIVLTHRLTLDERNSCPSRPTVLYV